LPDPGSGDPRTLYAAIDTERTRGEICCSPVAHWDDADGRWRPTVIVGATSDAGQFSPTADVRILVPGDVVRCETVSGSTLQPLDLEDTPFSLFAVPVVARDVLRLHESLRTAGLDPAQIAGHPVLVGLVELLQGAAGEWMDAWDRGLDGPAPRPVVVALSPGLWGFSDEDQPATVWERAAD